MICPSENTCVRWEHAEEIMQPVKCQAEMSQRALCFFSTTQWSPQTLPELKSEPPNHEICGCIVFLLNFKGLSCYYWTSKQSLTVQQCLFKYHLFIFFFLAFSMFSLSLRSKWKLIFVSKGTESFAQILHCLHCFYYGSITTDFSSRIPELCP